MNAEKVKKSENFWVYCLLVTVSGILLFFVFFIDRAGAQTANWREPSANPPLENVPAPLNINTQFFGDNFDISGGWDYTVGKMKLTLSGCSNPNEVLKWDEEQKKWVCGEAQANDLLSVLQKGSDASEFAGDVKIGSETTGANLYLGGELQVKWLHATADGANSIMGDLGLGTDSPQSRLHVYDDSKNAEIDLESQGANGNYWAIYHDGGTNSLRFWNESVAGDKNSLTLDAEGDVGIGTVSPNSKLHIYDTSNNAEIDIQSVAGTGNHWAIYHDATSGDLRFWNTNPTGDKNVLTLNNAGTVGINNSSPDENYKLDVGGKVKADDFCLSSGRCLSGGLLFAGQTVATFTGGEAGGYRGANGICANDYPSSHVCTTEEIMGLINSGLAPSSGYGWISSGPPGFPAIIPGYKAWVNDCYGWTISQGQIGENRYYGTWWSFDTNGGRGSLLNCNVDLPFLCCK